MSASRDLQGLIVDRLKADANVSALVTGVYDGRPSDSAFPCITIGSSQVIPIDYECLAAREETMQIDVWSRDNGRLNPCKAIVDAVHSALHGWSGALPDPNALALLRVVHDEVMIDRDGITAHGVVLVRAIVETG